MYIVRWVVARVRKGSLFLLVYVLVMLLCQRPLQINFSTLSTFRLVSLTQPMNFSSAAAW